MEEDFDKEAYSWTIYALSMDVAKDFLTNNLAWEWCTKKSYLSTGIDAAVSFDYYDNCINQRLSWVSNYKHNAQDHEIYNIGEDDWIYPLIKYYNREWDKWMDQILTDINHRQKDIWRVRDVFGTGRVLTGECVFVYSSRLSTDRYKRYFAIPTPEYARDIVQYVAEWMSRDYCGWFGQETSIQFAQIDMQNTWFVAWISAGQDTPDRDVNSLEIK